MKTSRSSFNVVKLLSTLLLPLLAMWTVPVFADADFPFMKGGYVSPMASVLFPIGSTPLDDGYGGILGLGYRSNFYAMEIAPTYGKQKPGTFQGAAINGLLFPFESLPNLYASIGFSGVEFIHYKSSQGKLEFNTVNFDPGVGYLLPLSLGRYDFAIRAEARYRVGRREKKYDDTDTDYDAPRHFEDAIVNVGLYLPLGMAPPPVVAAPAPAAVVSKPACSDGIDNDGDGKIDYPADPGCTSADDDDETDPPPPPPPPCKTPMPGERISLAGCGTGDVIVLRGVNFDFDKASLTANAKTILDNVSDELIAYPNINVELGGHTDSKGSDAYNLKLSDRRAKSVKAYLESKGIAPERLTAVGYGETQPIADNATDEGREMNRRVELKVVSSSVPVQTTAPGGDQTAPPPAGTAQPTPPAVDAIAPITPMADPGAATPAASPTP